MRIFLILFAVGALASACYSPAVPNGTQQCGLGGACPTGYGCGVDNRCYKAGQLPKGGDGSVAVDMGTVSGCQNDGDCKGDGGINPLACCNHLCVDPLSDGNNCGGCGKACAGASCCAGACSDTTKDPTHCGMCRNACAGLNATWNCAMSMCGVAGCVAGFGDCNMIATDGCEANLNSDPLHCGRCGTACVAAHAVTGCNNQACSILMCKPGFADCNLQYADGCEVATDGDPGNCGACSAKCALPNATAGCTVGKCVIAQCDPGFGDCDLNPVDGCEVNLTNDVNHCGGCGKTCPLTANVASTTCSASMCLVGACSPGFGDCDQQYPNGCEVNLTNDMAHCGACNKPCGGACVNGVCNNGKDRVAILGADAPNYTMDVQTKLLATGAFATVDLIDVLAQTPTLVQLQAYQAVLFWTDSTPQSPTVLSDTLANYYDGGGRVVVMTFATGGYQFNTGRFITGGYLLIDYLAGYTNVTDSLGVVAEPLSPLMAGVMTFATTAGYKGSGAPANGGIVVASWQTGKPLVLRGVIKGRRRADLNFWPVSSPLRMDGWTGDGAILMKNALLYQ